MNVPGFALSTLVGQGASAQVFRARSAAGGREVAVRVGRAPLADAAARQRFARRLTAARAIAAHPHVAAVRDGGLTDDGRPFVVMDLYRSGSYADVVEAGVPIPAEQVLDIGFALADVLVAAHAEGLVHGNISPAAILRAPDGSPVLAGFELGTSRAADVTVAGDVHDLGGTLLALVTGRSAGPRTGAAGSAGEHPAGDQSADESPSAVVVGSQQDSTLAVLRRATEVDPHDRYPSAEALRNDLAAVRAGRPAGGGIRHRPAAPNPSVGSAGDVDRVGSPGRPGAAPVIRTGGDGPASNPVDTRGRRRQPARVVAMVIGLLVIVGLIVVLVLHLVLDRTG